MRNPISSSATAPGTSSPASKTPCCTKVGMKRGPWTPEEDEVLANYIRKEGGGRWRTLPKRAGLLRCGKSCRLRWMNYLRPSVKRGHIAPDEEDLILRLHRLLGNRWSLIAGRIPGRTDNEIKNYWNTHLSKKLISQGIDPRTHKPLNSNPNSSINIQAPATKTNPNPNPNSSGVGPVEGDSHGRIIINKDDNENFKETNLDGKENWQNSLINEDDDIGYCTDDVFSSFLNSLINEEMFVNQQHQQQNPNSGASLDPLIFSSETTVWETALASSTAALNPEEHKRFVDHINKHF